LNRFSFPPFLSDVAAETTTGGGLAPVATSSEELTPPGIAEADLGKDCDNEALAGLCLLCSLLVAVHDDMSDSV
jgi:hypothetical protein